MVRLLNNDKERLSNTKNLIVIWILFSMTTIHNNKRNLTVSYFELYKVLRLFFTEFFKRILFQYDLHIFIYFKYYIITFYFSIMPFMIKKMLKKFRPRSTNTESVYARKRPYTTVFLRIRSFTTVPIWPGDTAWFNRNNTI